MLQFVVEIPHEYMPPVRDGVSMARTLLSWSNRTSPCAVAISVKQFLYGVSLPKEKVESRGDEPLGSYVDPTLGIQTIKE